MESALACRLPPGVVTHRSPHVTPLAACGATLSAAAAASPRLAPLPVSLTGISVFLAVCGDGVRLE